MRSIEIGRVWLVTTTLLAAIGCATWSAELETPEVFLAGLTPLGGGVLEQRFEVSLRVQNPNERDLELDGVDIVLEVNGRRLGRAVTGDSVTIPRLGEAVVKLEAVTTVFDLLQQLAAAPETSELRYALKGRVFLADSPAWLSFSREGVIGADDSP